MWHYATLHTATIIIIKMVIVAIGFITTIIVFFIKLWKDHCEPSQPTMLCFTLSMLPLFNYERLPISADQQVDCQSLDGGCHRHHHRCHNHHQRHPHHGCHDDDQWKQWLWPHPFIPLKKLPSSHVLIIFGQCSSMRKLRILKLVKFVLKSNRGD